MQSFKYSGLTFLYYAFNNLISLPFDFDINVLPQHYLYFGFSTIDVIAEYPCSSSGNQMINHCLMSERFRSKELFLDISWFRISDSVSFWKTPSINSHINLNPFRFPFDFDHFVLLHQVIWFLPCCSTSSYRRWIIII